MSPNYNYIVNDTNLVATHHSMIIYKVFLIYISIIVSGFELRRQGIGPSPPGSKLSPLPPVGDTSINVSNKRFRKSIQLHMALLRESLFHSIQMDKIESYDIMSK